jgi:hypothetical protein
MSEPKFTQGPLEVIAFGSPTADWVGAQFFVRAKDAPGGTAAIMGGLGKAEEKANAELYAMSPRMYAALHDIRMNNAGTAERKRGWDEALVILEELGVTE